MNRLVLIGNGFDLAHKLETSYTDFIGYLWRGIHDQLYEQIKLSYSDYLFKNIHFIDRNKLLRINITKISKWEGGTAYSLHASPLVGVILLKESISQDDIPAFILEIRELECVYGNKFFEKISTSYLEKNWCDIEADYYAELKKSIEGNDKTSNKENVKKLNEDFSQIKELLADYLSSNLGKPTVIPEIETHLYSNIKINHVKSNRLQDVCDYLNAIIPMLDETSRIVFSNYLSERRETFEGFNVNITPGYLRKKVHLFDDNSSCILAPEAIM